MVKPYKNKRKRRRKLAKKRYHAKQVKPKAGNILKYIQQYDPEHHQHLKFMLVARVSTEAQARKGYLDNQMQRLKRFADINNLKCLIDLCFIVSAFWTKEQKEKAIELYKYDPEFFAYDPRGYDKPHYHQLESLVSMMKARPNRAFLFESTCRAIRSDNYSFENKDAPISEDELKEFAVVLDGIPVITILHPEATFQEVQSWRISQEGHSHPNKSAGWTKRRYKIYHPKVIKHRAKGLSYGKIAKQLNLPIELVRSWCLKAKMKGLL
ncbi:MAG: hypothetical protein HQ580_16715 [Planctomycetes bacterium]|nr:hypothetical protein [Planctomycetota bacterium]